MTLYVYIYLYGRTMMKKSDIQPQLIAHAQIYRENITNKSGWVVVIYPNSNKNMMTKT